MSLILFANTVRYHACRKNFETNKLFGRRHTLTASMQEELAVEIGKAT